ncbi:MAG: PHA/PHB synthase family protein [Gammaproteobacteria bacterium]|uniref:PHA/PHB synthase family protein n=1 Tax=Pseudacidovorax sp. TaxID=1934311 RepID=UPI001B3E66B7|nr:alpha/beta fold hydrolase [Pseudacidovorax sp.]MBP6895447.1 polyhydroxyalkanoic acid synthase [Pseudacidovorax sp.]
MPAPSPNPVPTADAPADAAAAALDMQARATAARLTGALSPMAGLLAAFDWAAHLAASPGKQVALAQLAAQQAQALSREWAPATPDAFAAPDRRFRAPAWQHAPFKAWQQAFLASQQWWDAATHGVLGVERHHEDLVAFSARQWLDLLSPGNLPWANPEVIEATLREGGANLLRGLHNWMEDAGRQASGAAPAGTEQFRVGHEVAITPGKVVLRNALIELIQYAPATPTVHPEPVLLVPAWIMKYYILDLTPEESLVRYLVSQGHTVFCISWKNPGEAERDRGMDDYLQLGLHAALDAVQALCPRRKVHAAGYCLGGTLLAIGAAAMARDGDDRLASTTYFAAQTDFSEPGELGLFIDESQLSLLEAQMRQKGYLTAQQMAGAFSMLRSYDLLWSRMVGDYLLGHRAPMNALMAWNADATRMPARMHSEYLRRLFLDDDLSEGRFPVGGRPVSLGSLRLPTFMVGTVTDHVAPWRSVHKLHFLCPAEITFALTTGGHNAGIVNPPSPDSRRSHRLLTRPADGPYLAPDEWLAAAPTHAGSWWPAWQQWLAAHSGAPVKPPRMGTGLADAPGNYVLER